MGKWDSTKGTEFYDGEYYNSKDDFPDLGSWEATCEPNARKRSYQGMSTDIAKLPKYDDLLSGSSAICLDTGDVLLYQAGTKTWHQI